MERDVWRAIVRSLRRLPRRWPRNAVYSNAEVIAVLMWAALHDRPISWACRRASWPMQAWRRRLPDQSTMSRRMRDPALLDDLRAMLERMQCSASRSGTLIIDGKALRVADHTRDPDAANGWSCGGHARGYKLHAVIDTLRKIADFEVTPMNEAECVVARRIIERRHAAPGHTLLADASYDSNPLHAVCASRSLQLIAPRRKAHRSISTSHRQHPSRLRSIELTESDPDARRRFQAIRSHIERFFGELASAAGGLFALPPWARRLHRVRLWVAAKLAIYAAKRRSKHLIPA